MVVGIWGWIIQINTGLGVTGMRDYVSWGMYIANFVFFVAVSLIGFLISSALHLLKITMGKTHFTSSRTSSNCFRCPGRNYYCNGHGSPRQVFEYFSARKICFANYLGRYGYYNLSGNFSFAFLYSINSRFGFVARQNG